MNLNVLFLRKHDGDSEEHLDWVSPGGVVDLDDLAGKHLLLVRILKDVVEQVDQFQCQVAGFQYVQLILLLLLCVRHYFLVFVLVVI